VATDLPILRARHAAAVRISVAVVSEARADDFGRDTPCAGWTLTELLSHMTAQHRGFAAAAGGVRTDVTSWRPMPLATDPVAEYTDAAREVIEAFADERIGDREVWLPELRTERPFTGRDAMTFHFIDYVVHSWDVARTLDVPLTVDDDLAEAALAVALRVPTDPARRGPGFAFGPEVPVKPDASALDRALAALGRSPSWPD
jgi:uncharacterized protein (TIGR03086 family)